MDGAADSRESHPDVAGGDFHIDASPLDEGSHYYARTKIYQRASVGGDTVEVKWSGDLGDYPSDSDAIEAAQRWAIQWCDENLA
ncbi:hypothetical protein PQR02_28395 [Paraburkholderia sediminicola]|uniref:Uncharacterized protein n=1 Tax=Paraburkholderia rhynchosiae TaxID=487049 RepID=A0ACC7NGW0_9BURK